MIKALSLSKRKDTVFENGARCSNSVINLPRGCFFECIKGRHKTDAAAAGTHVSSDAFHAELQQGKLLTDYRIDIIHQIVFNMVFPIADISVYFSKTTTVRYLSYYILSS